MKTLRTVILTIYSSKETYNTMVGFFLFSVSSSLVSYKMKLNMAHNTKETVKKSKIELKLCQGATNTPTGVREN